LSKVKIDIADFIVDGIIYVCSKYKKRAPGSISEKECQKYFKGELSNWADQVDEETFALHPKAFMGSMTLSGLLNIVSVILLWLGLKSNSIIFPIMGTAVILFSVLLDTTESFLYRRFFDFLFPKATSINIMARRSPKGEVKRRIIFGGHADAAYEMTYVLHGQIKTVLPVLAGSSLGAAFVLISNISLLIHYITAGSVGMEGIWRAIGLIGIAFIPFFLAVALFTNWTRIVDGANDNLSACYVAMGVLKEMMENNIRYENTEVCCLITGSEEAGLRGALAYSERHRNELTSVETIFIALDTLREIDQFRAFTLGQNGTQKNSSAVGELLCEAGKNCGIKIRKSKLLFGATDAEGFSRNSIQSCGFCGVNLKPQLYYHTRFDTCDNISNECLQLSHEICMETARLYDSNEGINNFI
jgi:aminopeptidase YwaD